jgi:intracellular septation protein
MNAPEASTKKPGGTSQLLVDLGPVAVFMAAYFIAKRPNLAGENAIYVATGLFIAATLAALAYAWLVQKRLPPMLLVTGAVVLVFGGLTIWLRDPVFILIKPTIINLLYASAIFGGLLFRQNVWKMLFESAFPALPDRVWTIFAVRWGLFFILLAGLNELVWRNFTEEQWLLFKGFGVFPLTFLFALANAPLLMKHTAADKPAEGEASP